MSHSHTATNAPEDGRSFVGTEVNTGLATDAFEDYTQHVLCLALNTREFDAVKQVIDVRNCGVSSLVAEEAINESVITDQGVVACVTVLLSVDSAPDESYARTLIAYDVLAARPVIS